MSMTNATLLGASFGIAGSAVLFFTVGWYHSMIMWELHHFWPVSIIGLGIGAALAIATD